MANSPCTCALRQYSLRSRPQGGIGLSRRLWGCPFAARVGSAELTSFAFLIAKAGNRARLLVSPIAPVQKAMQPEDLVDLLLCRVAEH
jgi:hypothetical protein